MRCKKIDQYKKKRDAIDIQDNCEAWRLKDKKKIMQIRKENRN